ncbi:MAG: hypothetical protein KatS3mg090_0350 [Patescibacteria group bacterium]|nr:MAG: hypothetical protein KatS3mg090_0350 [Patescibacteria group bacterium]
MQESITLKKRIFIILFIASIVFTILCLYSAKVQSLWLDEAITARVVYQHNFFNLVTKFSVGDFHPPVYYLIEKLWMSFLPYNQVFLRLSSVIFILASFLILSKISIWAGLFLLFNPLIVYYAVEARMYALVVLLFTIIFVKFYNNKFDFVFYSAVFLSFLVFYGSVFYILGFLILLLFDRKYKIAIKTCLVVLASMLLVSPLLLIQFSNSSKLLSLVPNWSSVLGTFNLKNILLIFIKLVLGRVRPSYNNLYYFLIVLTFALIYLPVFAGSWRNAKTKRFMILFWLILISGLIFSMVKPILQYFRFIYLAVILAFLLSKIGSKYYRGFVLSVFCLLTLLVVFNKDYYREDWQKLVLDLPDESIVYMIPSVSDPVWFYSNAYNKKIVVRDLSGLTNTVFYGQPSIFVVEYAFDIFGVDRSIINKYPVEFSRDYHNSIVLHQLKL